MNRVFVLDSQKKPLMPCKPARARLLLSRGKAAVYRLVPFTIILKDREGGDLQPVEFKCDPGSKVTGIVLVGEFQKGRKVLWAAELKHRGQAIKDALTSRRSLRRGRRNRKTRYRAPRFDNRTRREGWLPPSIQSRVDNVASWAKRLIGRTPVSSCHVETVRFDTQKMQNPEIQGTEYQQGTLYGYEVREYLLEKWGRKCAYCDAEGIPIEIEHIVPRSKGGSDRVSNLTISCRLCNEEKDNVDVKVFLKDRPDRLKRILAQAKTPLKDVAAVNASRYAIGRAIKALGRPTHFWSGGRTKFNRTAQGYPKAHWIDAACVGETGAVVKLNPEASPLQVKATGRGTRQVVRTDRFGFPRTSAGRVKRVRGFQTGDLVKLVQPRGRYAGTHIGRLAGIRADGRFDISVPSSRVTAMHYNFNLLQRGDGYAYAV